ncbi:MAG: hypothetical protein J0I33_04475 [Microbacterium ginsengisoli]|jgi:hypothetical protein|uniref:hypothetical protein n=1 Tax=Microbacterium TaxID=33882 RepID=UPI0006FD837B|nr:MULTISPECIES: hypothetical protein [unclassified Microbacterium]MBN9197880.1 hypothetical protein [Microbacterium ginsengisoli]KQR91645.1 hypothetical protein ASF93_06960 [Microbacterium sp. Leaf347]KQR91725.1 hypothetical protein ASG00_04400 [Microbacterium sp. Leaf351]ODU79107.1 MAG: hypothetical protein ABT08_02315 [Microbacterium sp. SCN 71-21]OJU79229.1 MAG: hypothetical protein BGO15_09870 [Microbacterium sp. 71-23]
MHKALCNALFRAFGHRVCCGRIPDWTAHVGQRWDTFDLAPWNLYNGIWRVQRWVRTGMR